jgi:hypothetical protein
MPRGTSKASTPAAPPEAPPEAPSVAPTNAPAAKPKAKARRSAEAEGAPGTKAVATPVEPPMSAAQKALRAGLDRWLPLATGPGLLTDVMRVSVDHPTTLLTLVQHKRLAPLLLVRFSDTEALVDPGREDDFVRELQQSGLPATILGATRGAR